MVVHHMRPLLVWIMPLALWLESISGLFERMRVVSGCFLLNAPLLACFAVRQGLLCFPLSHCLLPMQKTVAWLWAASFGQ